MSSHKYYEQSLKINSERLFLRPIIENDSDLIVSWRNSLEVRSMLVDTDKLTIETHLKWFKSSRCNRIDYVFCENTKGKAIGTVNFKNIDELVGSAEAGKLLGDVSFRKKGLAKEAFLAWMKYGFDVLGLKKIYIFTRKNNIGNINLNMAIGFNFVEQDNKINTLMDGFIEMEIFPKDLKM
jgi:RimJ/RimL family protein N-acetyltransferase